ncbi:MAG TPA: N-acetylneuraminate synthase [Bacteroidales bacterium]|nr:N-acetylneuraminate synthase [Bacteroidales bacterium]
MKNKVTIIAEAGVNHNGYLENAYKLIDIAKNAGADYVKFQISKPGGSITKYAPKAKYQIITTGNEESQYEMGNKLRFTFDEHIMLMDYCKKVGIKYLSSPFDISAVNFLVQQNIPFWKIASGEITNYPFLVAMAKYNKEIVMSTGMSSLEDIENAIDVLTQHGTERNKITLLQCNTEYPTPMWDVNLKVMQTLKDTFKLPIGYSDHTLGIEVPIAAVALGATIIEKHFTLDRNMTGPDHLASLEPDELFQMVKSIRNIELAIGDGVKRVSLSEINNRDVARKSIVASGHIKKNEIFSDKNLTTKRPASGISPMEWESIIGKKAKRDFEEDELIEL